MAPVWFRTKNKHLHPVVQGPHLGSVLLCAPFTETPQDFRMVSWLEILFCFQAGINFNQSLPLSFTLLPLLFAGKQRQSSSALPPGSKLQ